MQHNDDNYTRFKKCVKLMYMFNKLFYNYCNYKITYLTIQGVVSTYRSV